MKDVHGVMQKLPLLSSNNYPFQLSNSFCGDKTYIKVNGKWQYIFFFFDAVKKIILSYRVSPNRDTLSAVKAIDDVLSKFEPIPEDLAFVVDGNPIYILAQHFLAQHDIHFDIKSGSLTNEDPVSTEYRPIKQIIERLNRTYKRCYKTTYGPDGSISFTTLFTAYFNFLRPHLALEHSVPVAMPELADLPNMPARWTRLLKLAENYLVELQQAS